MRIARTRAHVVTGTGASIDYGTVVVEDDRLVSVVRSESSVGADLALDLEGRALLPG